MVEARVPDELRDWNAMDIFIFSNGQEYSPPRKYHLCSDDLKFWDSTISFLAHSQYGSLHSKIELYTIGGLKVDGPLELSNDAAYVAVKPPDPFIQSGYDKYLLKASRSWEKRQGKILSGAMNPIHEKIHLSGNLDITKTTNKPIKEDSVSTTDTGKSSKRNSATKHKPAIAKLTQSPNLSKDPIERRKLLTTKAILKKRTEKLSNPSSNDSSIIKNLGVVDKTVLKQGLTPNETPIIDAILETESSASAKKITNDNKVTADNGLSVIMEKNEILNKHPDIETQSMRVDPDKHEQLAEIKNNETVINPDQNVSVKASDIGTQHSHGSMKKLTKEGTFNLNVNIEVVNRPNPVNSMALKKCFNIQSESDVLVNLEGIDPVVSETVDAKVVVVRCSCGSRADNILSLAKEKDRDYFVLVPTQGMNVDGATSTIEEITNKTYKVDEKIDDNLSVTGKKDADKISDSSNTYKEAGKIAKSTFTQTEADKIEQISFTHTDKKTDDIEENSITPTDKKSDKTAESAFIQTDKRADKIKGNSTDNVKDLLLSIREIPLPNEGISANVADKQILDCSQNASTQTEWCNVLLEARCNHGGYTFHLPSIEQLKEFKTR